MNTTSSFDHYVKLRYQLYNSLFLTLPFDLINQTGTLLPLLSALCEQKYQEGASPEMIINEFFEEYIPDADDRKQIDVLFNIVKYIERQVVLFDAIEEAAFDKIHDLKGPGTIQDTFDRIEDDQTLERLLNKLQDFRLRIVLTAHPTQFYPGPVLGIITDLAAAIRNNDLAAVNEYLLQLGKTPFINRQSPTPLDEARSLIWYLENVFYKAITNVVEKVASRLARHGIVLMRKDLICMGFWPGGDRDGNPFVTADITRQTASRLRRAIVSCYHRDVRELRRRLTFQGVHDRIVDVEYRLFDGIYNGPRSYPHASDLLSDLYEILHIILTEHDELFADHVSAFIKRVEIFGFFFATLDIRQDSRKHEFLLETILRLKVGDAHWESYQKLSEHDKIEFLTNTSWRIVPENTSDDISKDIIGSILAMHDIQHENGAQACHRYVISNTRNALDMMTLLSIVRWTIGETDHIDIVPLFETIDDLKHAGEVMDVLYANEHYMSHLRQRNQQQTIMLGFSDGTKDGGYLRANWSIFQAKETLTKVSHKYDVHVLFFDGRGGPPSRGGGNTHKFYSSLGSLIENKEVQLTIQGQTVSSNFGSHDAAVYNIEQLFSAGIENAVFLDRDGGTFQDKIFSPENTRLTESQSRPTARLPRPDEVSKKSLPSELTDHDRGLLDEMAEVSYESYASLKQRPEFLAYLQEVGTLDYYGVTNIGSRPVKRGQKSALTLDSLRAIPFTGSWSQMKQNVPGYYGFGTALKAQQDNHHLEEVSALYLNSRFFQTLVGNSMQSLSKSFFPLTAYLANDPEFGGFWQILYDEYQLTVELLLKISNQNVLMDDARDIRKSIQLREQIVLPLLTIQQAALQKIRSGVLNEEQEAVYRKVVLRTMYGIINAGRNVA